MTGKLASMAGIAALATGVLCSLHAGEGSHRASTLGSDMTGRETATASFAAGCFWHVEDTFRGVEGVVATEVGYEGGHFAHPTYRDVCTDRTGHAETVRVTYDPSKISYAQLLEKFFALHDPTTVDRQGPDEGTQYRSVIFYNSPGQQKEAESFKAALASSGQYRRPIATEIVPASTFWKAEDYHQQYYEKERRGEQ